MAAWVALRSPSAPIIAIYAQEIGRMPAEPKGAAQTGPAAAGGVPLSPAPAAARQRRAAAGLRPHAPDSRRTGERPYEGSRAQGRVSQRLGVLCLGVIVS